MLSDDSQSDSEVPRPTKKDMSNRDAKTAPKPPHDASAAIRGRTQSSGRTGTRAEVHTQTSEKQAAYYVYGILVFVIAWLTGLTYCILAPASVQLNRFDPITPGSNPPIRQEMFYTLQKDVQQLQESYTGINIKFEKHISTTEQRISSLENVDETNKKSLFGLEKTINEHILETEIPSMKATMKQTEYDLQNTQAQVEQLKEKQVQQAQSLEALTSEVRVLEQKDEVWEVDLPLVKERTSQMEKAQQGMKVAMDTLRNDHTGVSNSHYQLSSTVEVLKPTVLATEKMSEDLTGQLSLLQTNVDGLHSMVKQNKAGMGLVKEEVTNWKLILGSLIVICFIAIRTLIQRKRATNTEGMPRVPRPEQDIRPFGHNYPAPAQPRTELEPGLCVVSFSEETGRSTRQLLHDLTARHLQGALLAERGVSLSCHEDISRIPATRRCLLVLNADPRGLVLERKADMRGDFRLSALNYALLLGCDVMLLVYGESRAAALPDERLYLQECDRVEGCQALRTLIGARKLLTMNFRFSEAQSQRMAQWLTDEPL